MLDVKSLFGQGLTVKGRKADARPMIPAPLPIAIHVCFLKNILLVMFPFMTSFVF